MKVMREFATPLGFFQLDPNMCSKYANLIKILSKDKSEDNFYYRDLCITTPDNLHIRTEFAELKTAIQLSVNEFAENELGIDKDDLTMTCMWANLHSSGNKHHYHTHPNSFVSGVVYVNCPDAESIGNIHFNDPRPAKNMIYPDFKKESSISNRSIWIKPQLGLLILFPSWLEHGTGEFITDTGDQRIAVSFNFVLNKASYKTMRF